MTGGDTEHTRAAKQLAQERGLKLVLFGGGNLEIRQNDGTTASARAYIIGDRVYVRADHPRYTSEQLMRHETGHDRIAKGEINPNTVRERIGAEWAHQISGMYAEAYEGSGMTAEEIWEEIICDSLADMNIFSEQESAETVGEVLEETKKASTVAEAEQTRGPPEAVGKMSIELEDLADNIQKIPGIKWNGGRSIELSKAEYAAVTSRISTRYHYANTLHDGVQVVDRTTEGKNAQHYVYLYTDHGFGSYQIIGRLTYGWHDELISFLREEINNDRKSEGISKSTDRLRNFYEHPDSSGFAHYDRAAYGRDEQTDTESRGVRAESDRRTGRTDIDRHDGGGNSGEVSEHTSQEPIASISINTALVSGIQKQIRQELDRINQKQSGQEESFFEENTPLEGQVQIDAEAFLYGLDSPYERSDSEYQKSQLDVARSKTSNPEEVEKYGAIRYHEDGPVVVTDDWKENGKVSIPKRYNNSYIVETIGRSVGAKARNYSVYDPKTGDFVNLVEGSRITQPKNHVMAGYGRDREIDCIDWLIDRHGGDPVKWTKEKGFGYVEDEYGEVHQVELHWYQEPTIGKVEMKLKYRDGRLYLDE